MSELDKVMIGAVAATALLYLVGPSAVWRIIKTAGEWAVVILFLIWAL
jgi:hypothetical protein